MFSMKIKELKGKINQETTRKKCLYDNCKSRAQSIQTAQQRVLVHHQSANKHPWFRHEEKHVLKTWYPVHTPIPGC